MDTSPPSLLPSSFFIYVNKEYYKNKVYLKYSNRNSIMGILSKEVLSFLSVSVLDIKIKLKIMFFLSMIKMKVNYGGDKHSVMDKGQGWVHLKHIFLENLFGTRDWGIIKETCLNEKFIELNDWYIPNNFSMSYRLNPEHKKYKTVRYFAKGKAFNTLMRKLSEIPRKNAPNKENAFEKKISEYFESILKEIEISAGYEDLVDSLPGKKREAYEASCERVMNKDYNIGVNRLNGRWTNSITNFPKILRQKLLFKGQRMMELDFANMQPWMAIELYESDCPEKQEYLSLVQSAQFYDFFAQKTEHDISTDKKRKNFKKRILREIYFGGLDKIGFYKTWRVFCGHFPILAEIILKHRERGKREFAMFLQRKESKIMIDGALNEIIDRGLSCLTIHDSILCLRKDYLTVLSIMEKHFMRQIPYKPTVK